MTQQPFQEANWRGFRFPPGLSHVTTKHPNQFLLHCEIIDIERHISKQNKLLRTLNNNNKHLSDEAKDKQLDRFLSRLKYNQAVLDRQDREVLGKRKEEEESESIAKFYQECGVDIYASGDYSRHHGTPGSKGEEWFESKNKKRNEMRKYDPRIRGMIRLSEQMSAHNDVVKISYLLLRDEYEEMLDRFKESLEQEGIPGNLPTEDAIENLVTEMLKNKKVQERTNKMLSRFQNTTCKEEEVKGARQALETTAELFLDKLKQFN